MRVALADDDVLLRAGLASLLERSGFEVVGQCGEASELIALVREHRPDLVLVDIRMPPTHSTEGLDAARVIREEFPRTAILVLSAHVEVEHAMDLLASPSRRSTSSSARATRVRLMLTRRCYRLASRRRTLGAVRAARQVRVPASG